MLVKCLGHSMSTILILQKTEAKDETVQTDMYYGIDFELTVERKNAINKVYLCKYLIPNTISNLSSDGLSSARHRVITNPHKNLKVRSLCYRISINTSDPQPTWPPSVLSSTHSKLLIAHSTPPQLKWSASSPPPKISNP